MRKVWVEEVLGLTKIGGGARAQALQEALKTAGFLVVEVERPDDVRKSGAQAVVISGMDISSIDDSSRLSSPLQGGLRNKL